MQFEDDNIDEYEEESIYEDYGEGFVDEFDAVSEKAYEKAFETQSNTEETEGDFEFDEVVGGRDKKPVLSLLNKGKLSKYEMDDLLNQL